VLLIYITLLKQFDEKQFQITLPFSCHQMQDPSLLGTLPSLKGFFSIFSK